MSDHLAHQIAKLTGTGRCDLSSPGRDTSNASITAPDIAAALSFANVTRTQYLAALYVYAHDYSVQSELYYRLNVEAIAMAANWELTVRLFTRMFRLAIAESFRPGVCQTCNGTRSLQTTVAGAYIPCADCDSTGRQIVDDHDRAKILDMSYSNYRQRWRPRYEQLREWVDRQPRAALDSLRDRIGSGG